jgi:hypothetical protein
MTTTHAPLTLHALRQLASLADCVFAGQPITRVLDDGEAFTGTARAFTRLGGGFLDSTEDIRDGYVWISGLFEQWWPVSELLAGLDNGTVALNYRP